MIHTLITTIAKGLLAPIIFVSSLAGYNIQPVQNIPTQQAKPVQQTLGAINYVTGGGTYRLRTTAGSSDTSIQLSSFKEPISNTPYTMAYLNAATVYATIDPQTNKSEFISFTGITQNSDGTAVLTGVTRGLSRSYPYTASTTFRLPHAGQSILILSNSPQVYNEIYDYINNATYAGTVDMSTTIKGIGEQATALEAARHTLVGNTSAPLVLTTLISSSTRTANTAQVVISSSTDGYIDSSYLNLGSLPATTFTGNVTLSGTATSTIASSSIVMYTTATTTAVYTKPSNLKYIVVELVAGGGGGGSSSGIGGGTGSNSSFGSFCSATGGANGNQSTDGGGGGGSLGAIILNGNQGTHAMFVNGASGIALYTVGGMTALMNYGQGGAGYNAGSGAGGGTGGAGGGGGYCKTIIPSSLLSATTSYTIGAGGAAQTGGTVGSAGAAGALIITQYFY
jgi:hypothetical protein